MLRNLFLAFVSLLAVPALAQTTTPGQPADLPPFVQQPFNLPGPGQTESLGDGLGTTLWGGTPPVYSTMPANIPTPNVASLLSGPATSFCGGGPTDPLRCTLLDGTTWREPEPKARFTLKPCYFYLPDDPVVYPRQPGKAHLHSFAGNCGVSAGSTYASLRQFKNGRSTLGDINRSAYWPAPECRENGFGDGRTYCPFNEPGQLYYQAHNVEEARKSVFLPIGYRSVWGTLMTDPEDRWIKRKISEGNALNQAAFPGGIYNEMTNSFSAGGRYAYLTNGFNGFKCTKAGQPSQEIAVNGSVLYPYLATPTGDNPWPGCTGTGPFNIEAELDSPNCMDGVNAWGGSSGPRRGAGHTYHAVMDNSTGKTTCFNGHYRTIWLKLKFQKTYNTAGEWVYYRLTSDPMAQSKLNAEYAARGQTAPIMPNGWSFHGDAFLAWDDNIFRLIQKNMGVMGGIDGDSNPDKVLEMNDSTISKTQKMIMPVVTLRPTGTLSPSTMFRVPNRLKGAVQARGHHVM